MATLVADHGNGLYPPFRPCARRTPRPDNMRGLPKCVWLLPVLLGTFLCSSTAAFAARAGQNRHAVTALPPPGRLVPFPGTSLAGQGRWQPAGRLIAGRPAIYDTTLEPQSEPGVAAGIAWMDPKLLRPTLYSGSLSPGGFGWKYTAPVEPVAARALVAAFNGGFQFPSSDGGYFSEGKTVFPLRVGGCVICNL